MGSCAPEWGNDRADETRCPRDLGAECAPGELCVCRTQVRTEPVFLGGTDPAKPSKWLEAARASMPGGIMQRPAPLSVPEAIRREAWRLAGDSVPGASLCQRIQNADLIARWLYAGSVPQV